MTCWGRSFSALRQILLTFSIPLPSSIGQGKWRGNLDLFASKTNSTKRTIIFWLIICFWEGCSVSCSYQFRTLKANSASFTISTIFSMNSSEGSSEPLQNAQSTSPNTTPQSTVVARITIDPSNTRVACRHAATMMNKMGFSLERCIRKFKSVHLQ